MSAKSQMKVPDEPEMPACNESREFRDLTEEELEEWGERLRRTLAEEDAIDLQCLADGHSDRDWAAATRERLQLEREVYHFLRREASNPDRSQPLSFAEARDLVRQHITYPVPDDTVFAAYEMLLEDMPDDISENP